MAFHKGILDALFPPPLAPLYSQNPKTEDAEYGTRERALYKAYNKRLYKQGKWHQGITSDGAQYVGKSPFSRNGITCDNCVYFQPIWPGQGPDERIGACYIVEGEDIKSGGFCKLWIIPDDLLK